MTQQVPFAMLENTQYTDIASAATVDLDAAAGGYGQITGAVAITAITLSTQKLVWARFTGALTLTNGASLVLPTGANITTAAGDWALFAKIGSIVYCLFYSRANGTPVAASAPGNVVAVSATESTAVASGSTTIPLDDTIPQSGEGNALGALDVTHTAKAATNKLKITATVQMSHSVATSNVIAALFIDAGANSVAAAVTAQTNGAGQMNTLVFTHYMTVGDISAHTYKVRYGSSVAGTVTVNGSSAARLLGGVMASSLVVEEIAA